MAITDRRGRITHVNEPFCRISRHGRDQLIGRYHNIVNSGHHPPAFFKISRSAFSLTTSRRRRSISSCSGFI
ncbi:hypothetical protein [Ciceribacter selenitireducens]